MPLHLLGKKSWNVYNADNIARVRRDEAAARAEAAESERRQHDREADARLALLRGQDLSGQSLTTDHAETLTHRDDSLGHQRKKRRLAGEDDTDRGIHLARSHRDESAHQGMKLADAGGRHSHGAPAPAPALAWYMTAPADHSASSSPGRDVWGNEDAGRRARDQKRFDANDPLAAMKKGITQLRRADEHRKAWREQRERDLAGVEPLYDLDLDARPTTIEEDGGSRTPQQKERHTHFGSIFRHGKKKRPVLDSSSSPGSGSRHHSGIFGKLFLRSQDAMHNEEEAPLLADADERQEIHEPLPPQPKPGLTPSFGTVLKAIEASRKVVQATQAVSNLVQSQSQTTARGSMRAAKATGRHVRMHKHKYIGGIIAVAAITAVGLGVAYGVRVWRKSKLVICKSALCILAVEAILGNLHPDVASMLSPRHVHSLPSFPIDPCTDFDQFVCGGFAQHHQFRSDQSDISTRSVMADNVDAILRQVLERPPERMAGPDKHLLTLAKDAYKACMDEGTLQKVGLSALTDLVDGIKACLPVYSNPLGPAKGYNLQNSALSRPQMTPALTNVVIQSILNGASTFIDFHVGAPSHQVLFASPVQSIGLPYPDLYDQEDSELMADYRLAVKQSLANFYNDPPNSTLVRHSGIHADAGEASLSDAVVEFESKLAHIVLASEQNSAVSPAYIRLSLADFANLLPELDIKAVFQRVAKTAQRPDYLIVSSLAYLSRLSVLLQQTQLHTLQAFFVWKTIQQWSDRVDDARLSKLILFKTRLGGTKTALPEDRWRHCIHDISSDLGWIASHFYVNEGLPSSRKDTAANIVDDVKVAFYKILTDSTWMPLKDRHTAALKVRRMQAEIAYPTTKPDIGDPYSVNDYYRLDDLQLSKDAYLLNGVATTRQQVRRQWSKAVGSPTDKHEWDLYSTAINPLYKYTVNTIFVPAAILQPPVLHDPSLPSFLSYGAFGPIAGHGISRAFDTVGAHYSINGTYNNWWSDVTAAEYDRKSQCFANQYSSYTVPGPDGEVHINGTLTLAEAIADSAGANAAFQAWKEHKRNEKAQTLPGLKVFSNDQLFWLSYGSFWCSKARPEQLQRNVPTSPHAPNSVRILVR
ncbi:hypothetical protein DV737_g5337, partial [Chaetothyriales sp. CBS 132003]